ncbi:hypothetical protein J2Y58_002944 [Sphingomonas sp. BE138]|nr:hypothetical protein [Sphingomonas sp. BE138]MDR6789571.1 hypothetical protein [Sphingomonas sp. BE138]
MPIDIDEIADLPTPVANTGTIRVLEEVADHTCEYITAIVIMTSQSKKP